VPLVVTDVGEVYMLRWTLRPDLERIARLRFHLYSNDTTPHRSSVVEQFEECDFAGYEPRDLEWDQWSAPLSVGGVAASLYGSGFLEFVPSSGSQTVYGYLVTDPDDEVCLWAERLPAPIEASPSLPVLIQPAMRGRSEFEPPPPGA
jgi:hypothetical protein